MKNQNIGHCRGFLSAVSSLEKVQAVETPDTNIRGWKQAFTLIELLIVVLIIGVLSAVALPQYRLAVLKSRYTQLVAMGESIYQAAQSYYLANNAYPARFDALDIDIPGTGDSYSRVYGDYTCNIYTGRLDRADGILCVYVGSAGNLGYRIVYANQTPRRCMASTSWLLGNQLCQNITGQKNSSGTYGAATSDVNFYYVYKF